MLVIPLWPARFTLRPAENKIGTVYTYLFKEQPYPKQGQRQEPGADQVRKSVGELLEELHAAKEIRVRARGVGEDAAQDRTYDDADVEGHGQQQEGAGLVLLLANDLADHGPHDADVAVGDAAERAEEQGLVEGGGEAEAEARYERAKQADDNNGLATGPARVGDTAPHHRRQELRGREAGVQDAGLPRDDGIRQRGVEPFELVEHVRLERRLHQRLAQPRHGDDD